MPFKPTERNETIEISEGSQEKRKGGSEEGKKEGVVNRKYKIRYQK